MDLLVVAGAGAAQGQQGEQPAAPAGPNTQPLDMFNPQVHLPSLACMSPSNSDHIGFDQYPYTVAILAGILCSNSYFGNYSMALLFISMLRPHDLAVSVQT